ncbi:hypothetical protein QFC22_000217 [Naganishia vaughanmartiniae]|uniref:Uncharacterized protein n=1 Tax=Naganishia vaughanmartiniae TaxID=1424756 RepID=A0ACC2XPS0_9TREE|nr:hypothetical protein QFC22_000217 [Naganishia vaughanmartiniae]
MGKRGAEDQLTKDDVESGRGGRDDSDNEDNMARDAPKEVIATRQIRGMPKRKTAAVVPAAVAPTSAFGSAPTNATTFAGFGSPAPATTSFGGNTTALTTSTPAAKPAFSFGAPSTAPASEIAAPKAFSGFSFGVPPATSAPTSFTSTAAASIATPAPSASASKPSSDSSSTAKTPFSGFSFGPPPPTTPKADPPVAASSKAPSFAAPSSTSSFGGFGNSPQASPASVFGAAPTPAAASSMSTSTSFGSQTAASNPKTSNTSTQQETPKEDQKEVEYLTSVRGLNESVVQALSVKIRDEPFINLVSALESVKAEYNDYLEEIKKKAGKSSAKPAADSQPKKRDASVMDDITTSAPAKKQTTEASKPSFAMPAPPSMPSAGGFKLPAATTTSTSTSTSTGGFKPSLPASTDAPTLPAVGGFKIPAATTNGTSKPDTTSSGFKPTLPSSTTKPSPFAGFSFGQAAEKKDVPAKSATPEAAAASPSTSSTTSFTQTAAEKRPSSQASLFAQSVIDKQEKEKDKEQQPKQNAPATPSSTQKQSSIFAIKPTVKAAIGESMVVPSPPSSSGTPSFLFKAPPAPASSTTPSKLPSFSFNMGSTDSSAGPKTPGTPGSSGTFSFAATKPRSTSAGFGFGFGVGKSESAQKDSTKGEEKDPVPSTTPSQAITSGFSFGATAPRAPPAQPMFLVKPGENGKLANPTFSFGPTSTFSVPTAGSATGDSSAVNTDSEEAPAEAGPQADLTTGEGEEDEETLWQGRVQVGTFGKSGDGSGPMVWGDWKVCILRLNREKNPSGGAQPMRRILARVDPSGAIAQNFSLRSLTDMSLFTETSYKMTVAETGGIKQVALRFGKKRPGFDSAAMMEKFKSAVQMERDAMGLPALPSLK